MGVCVLGGGQALWHLAKQVCVGAFVPPLSPQNAATSGFELNNKRHRPLHRVETVTSGFLCRYIGYSAIQVAAKLLTLPGHLLL